MKTMVKNPVTSYVHDKNLALDLVRQHFNVMIKFEESRISMDDTEEDIKMVEQRIKRLRSECSEITNEILSNEFSSFEMSMGLKV
jgi:hypothetical protein